jgi:hypothetical protein
LILGVSIPVVIPGITVAPYEACYAFGIDILAVDPKGSLLPSGGALLLLANHQMHFLGLDVFANMPCREAIFVLFFSANEIGNVRLLWSLFGSGGEGYATNSNEQDGGQGNGFVRFWNKQPDIKQAYETII